MQHVLNAGADVVIIRGKENLCFVFQPSKRQGMDDFGLVSKVFVPHVRRVGMAAAQIYFIGKGVFVHKIMIP